MNAKYTFVNIDKNFQYMSLVIKNCQLSLKKIDSGYSMFA